MTTFSKKGCESWVGFVDFCRLTRWIGSASQLTRLSTVGIWLLLRVERLQAAQEGRQEVLEKPAGRNRALADSGSSSREKRATTRVEEGLSQKGAEECLHSFFLPSDCVILQ